VFIITRFLSFARKIFFSFLASRLERYPGACVYYNTFFELCKKNFLFLPAAWSDILGPWVYYTTKTGPAQKYFVLGQVIV
jgi:hypothetical protein